MTDSSNIDEMPGALPEAILETRLQKRRADGLYRTRRILSDHQSPYAIIDGQPSLTFCSNDYLGLAGHPQLIEAMYEGTTKYGVGSGASHLVSGHHDIHHELEAALADFTGQPRALLFSTGYMANIGVLSALAGRSDCIFSDKLNHASLIDGAQLSGAKKKRYPHANMGKLEQLLQAHTDSYHYAADKQRLIVSDGIFSMDGDLAPLPKLKQLAEQYKTWLIIDDAHGLGVLGKTGGGCFEHFQIQPNNHNVLIGTFGKAFGTSGAFVAGSEALIETLIQHARSYIYTTAIPPAMAYTTLQSLNLVQSEGWRRDRLNSLIKYFRKGAQILNIPLMDSFSPIQPVIIGDSHKTVAISDALLKKGILVTAIRPPTVAEGSARLRITLSANHSEEDVDHLLSTLSEALAPIPIQAPNKSL